MGEYEPYTLGRRNLNCEKHWEPLASSLFRITKPTVICFGGNVSTTARDANAMCKIAQGLVGAKLPTTEKEFATIDDVDFIGVGYGKNEERDSKGYLTKNEKLHFVSNMFLPLCVDEKGSILPKEQIIKNFNQISFFSHCYGAKEISSIVGVTYKEMLKMGIEDEVANDAIDQMFSVSYAPYQNVGIPSLQVISMKDRIMLFGPKGSKVVGRFLANETGGETCGGTVAFKEDDYTATVLVSGLVKENLNEHPIEHICRNENWEYINNESVEYGDEVSQVMGYALASSVANSIQNQNSNNFISKPSVEEILEGAKSILGETQSDVYESSIESIKRELNPNFSQGIVNDSMQGEREVSFTGISTTSDALQEIPLLENSTGNSFEQ